MSQREVQSHCFIIHFFSLISRMCQEDLI